MRACGTHTRGQRLMPLGNCEPLARESGVRSNKVNVGDEETFSTSN